LSVLWAQGCGCGRVPVSCIRCTGQGSQGQKDGKVNSRSHGWIPSAGRLHVGWKPLGAGKGRVDLTPSSVPRLAEVSPEASPGFRPKYSRLRHNPSYFFFGTFAPRSVAGAPDPKERPHPLGGSGICVATMLTVWERFTSPRKLEGFVPYTQPIRRNQPVEPLKCRAFPRPC
jgi:hypothetical protein